MHYDRRATASTREASKLVTALLFLAAAIFLLWAMPGCNSDSDQPVSRITTEGITTPLGTKEGVIVSATGEIKVANKDNPNPPSQAAISAGVARIEHAIASAPAEVSIEQIKAVERAYNSLADSHNALRDEFKTYIAKVDADMRALIVKGLLGLGLAIIAGGVGVMLWTSYKIVGGIAIGIGFIVCAAGPVLTKPWVQWLFLGAGILAGVAFGIRYTWGYIDKNRNGRPDFLEKKPSNPPAPPS